MGELLDPDYETRIREFRGRAARARGRRWELYCRKKFSSSGFRCLRQDETDFGYGCDLLLFKDGVVGPLPVAIQCKSTLRKSDLLKGLREAERGWPTAKIAICLHALHFKGLPRSELKIATTLMSSDPFLPLRWPSWHAMITLLNRRLFGDLRDAPPLP